MRTARASCWKRPGTSRTCARSRRCSRGSGRPTAWCGWPTWSRSGVATCRPRSSRSISTGGRPSCSAWSCSPTRMSPSSANGCARRRGNIRTACRSAMRSTSRRFRRSRCGVAVNSALSNVAQTFIVVGALVVVFLGLRAGLVAAMIVPFAVMFSVIGMRALGIALEQVSIAAVIIALGLLVDNGVVIVEDIMSRTARGVAPEQAALASGQQYAFPLLVSSVTTVAAFLPLFLLSGASGEYAYSLAAVVALTLAGSWIVALYILPPLTIWLIGRRALRTDESGLAVACAGPLRRHAALAHPVRADRAGRMLRPCRARRDAVWPRAQADVSAERARPVPDLHEHARRRRHLGDRGERACRCRDGFPTRRKTPRSSATSRMWAKAARASI